MSEKGDSEKIANLRKVLTESEDTAQKLSAIDELRQFLEDKRAISMLATAACDDRSFSVRQAAAIALGESKDSDLDGIREAVAQFLQEQRPSRGGQVFIENDRVKWVFDDLAKSTLTAKILDDMHKAAILPAERKLRAATRPKQGHQFRLLELPDGFIKLLSDLSIDSGFGEAELIKMGLALSKLANKAKQQGFRMAVIDADGTVIANIDGY